MRSEERGTTAGVATWIDVSLSIGEGTPAFPGDPGPTERMVCSVDRGQPVNLKQYQITGHVATHVDAPRHLFPDGKSVDELEPALFLGPASLVYLPVEGVVELEALSALVEAAPERLLLKTLASTAWSRGLQKGFPIPYLSPAAAEWLVERGVQLFGTDSLSVDAADSTDLPAHRILLQAGVPILEALTLAEVVPGVYWLCAVPLALAGGDGSPVRALLKPVA